MLQKTSSVFIVYRRKTLTGSPDPTHANGTDKPCNLKMTQRSEEVSRPHLNDPCSQPISTPSDSTENI